MTEADRNRWNAEIDGAIRRLKLKAFRSPTRARAPRRRGAVLLVARVPVSTAARAPAVLLIGLFRAVRAGVAVSWR